MQTKFLADDLDLLVSGVCPVCGEPDHLTQHDAWNYRVRLWLEVHHCGRRVVRVGE